ncbi:Uncharacterised protein [Actinomyces viscosus]|uniref:Single-strand DNA deaminase toxin A-like C-terminal domain-containing protein n=1 Tax=Actinomyces viscosus TaxID=1656 RepID=A0A448PML1_ACTVI|nr:Uncharacterised protein [Actinomyces viscosus]
MAGAISGGLTLASLAVRMVHDLVRDAISDIIGKIASKVTIGVLTAGLAAPWVVQSVISDVASWVTRLTKEITDVVTSARNLKNLLDKATTLLDDVGEKFAGMAAMALGYGSKNTDNAAKGAKHADDAADAAKGADGAVPPSKGGGDGGGTPPGKGDKDGGGGGDDPAKKSQEAQQRAAEKAKEVNTKKAYKSKTVSSDHVKTLSGWSARRPEGFQDPNIDNVLTKCDEIGHTPEPHDFKDNGVPGQYHASHAEKQLSLTAKEPYIGVSKAMCPDCQGYFSKLAQHEGRDWYVTDPNNSWIFHADGTVTKQ